MQQKPTKNCPKCSKLIWHQSKTCRKCFRKDTVTQFWERVNKTPTCWLWENSTDTSGYGQFGSGKTTAHRYSYKLHYGEIPKNLCVLHKCDVRICVNPEHLFCGTPRDNVLDAVKKGRHIRGERMWKSKLIANDVVEIRSLNGKIPTIEIAKKFNVSRSTILHIFEGYTWKHIK